MIMAEKFYLTTPIYYVNDVPHIGHTCTTVAADILARFHRQLGDQVFFLTGTDEHGAKVAQAAEKENLTPQAFCDRVSENFIKAWKQLNISNDYFIRTTNPAHKKFVSEFIQKVYDKGDIYKAKYEGSYCIGCEKFVTETDLVNGKCPLHPADEIQKQIEENYFFKLSKYTKPLIKAIEDKNDQNHYQISPPAKKEEVLSKLKTGIDDLSISRANVPWGIPIPWDNNQTIYVWFDALLNYYTATKITDREEYWPTNLHLVGKEILWFHTVIWEAMLLSAGVPRPKKVFAHSFYMIDGQKMSKSIGNVIKPEDLVIKYGVDGTRYLIASSFPYSDDSDVSWKKFTEKYNADLANGLGNLVARVAKLAEKAEIKNPAKSGKITETKFKNYCEFLEKLQFSDALAFIWDKISRMDKEIDKNQPWKLEGEKLVEFLERVIPEILEISLLLEPFIPTTSIKIQKQFTAPTIKSEPPLFPRLY